VFGKAGRAATATDPAPVEMSETVINLKPEAEWRPGVTIDSLIAEMGRALEMPGVSSAWTMPIKARIDMLSTGIRTPVGIKVYGPDLAGIDAVSRNIEATVRQVPGTTSAFAERIEGGYFLEIEPDRGALARYGLTVGDLQDTITVALGGEPVTTTVDGRARYTVNVRYARDRRSTPEAIARQVLVQSAQGAAIPLGQVATVRLARGPATIRTENAQLVNYIYVDTRDSDIGGYVAAAQRAVAGQVSVPAGYHVEWSGQFEYMQRAKARMATVVPVTLLVIFVLLYLNFGRVTETLIVMLSVPFALIGGIWLMYLMQFNVSVAAAVGFIALAGVAAETGVIMLIYLEQAMRERRALAGREGRALTKADIRAAVIAGAVDRVRPKMMTVTAIMAGLLPILWSTGTGSELMRRIAAPMVGGMATSAALTLLVIPAIYALVKGWGLPVSSRRAAVALSGAPAQ
jgi:copper/silver efflux system protein